MGSHELAFDLTWTRQVQLTWSQHICIKNISEWGSECKKQFPAITQHHQKTYPPHTVVPPAWNQVGTEPGCTDTSTDKTGLQSLNSNFVLCFRHTHRSLTKTNMENIINRKQNGVWWLKTPSECSVLLSHKKYRAWETLRKLPLPKYFSLDRENSFWTKILFL